MCVCLSWWRGTFCSLWGGCCRVYITQCRSLCFCNKLRSQPLWWHACPFLVAVQPDSCSESAIWSCGLIHFTRVYSSAWLKTGGGGNLLRFPETNFSFTATLWSFKILHVFSTETTWLFEEFWMGKLETMKESLLTLLHGSSVRYCWRVLTFLLECEQILFSVNVLRSPFKWASWTVWRVKLPVRALKA